MPQLYLELLENKKRVDIVVIDKEYIPGDIHLIEEKRASPPLEQMLSSPPKAKIVVSTPPKISTPPHKVIIPDTMISKNTSVIIEFNDDEDSMLEATDDELNHDIAKKPTKNIPDAIDLSEDDEDEFDEDEDEFEEEPVKKFASAPAIAAFNVGKTISTRLDSLLASASNSDHMEFARRLPSRRDESDHGSVDEPPSPKAKKIVDVAPSLRELEEGINNKRRGIQNVGRVSASKHDEDEQKRELLFRFDILKESYPGSSIPEWTVHSDLALMQRSYDTTLRRLTLNSTVEKYKGFLIGGFSLMEYIIGMVGIDATGFAQQQIVGMNSYRALLVELGEKSYVAGGDSWPVEIRLLGAICGNAFIFVLGKILMKKTGANLMGSMLSANPQTSASNNKPQRRMRGPKIDLDDVSTVT